MWENIQTDPQAVVDNESAAAMGEVFVKSVERGSKGGHMEHVADENHISV